MCAYDSAQDSEKGIAVAGSKLNQWLEQAGSPAAPEGAHQAAQAAAGYEAHDPQYENSKLGQWTSQAGYVNQAKSWYTGGNQNGTNNGWDTEFAKKFINGQNEAAKQGKLNTYFEQPDATGVVTWDHASEKDPNTKYAFGDIYQDGKFEGNLYKQFDKPTADLMMSDWLLDAKQKAKAFGASDAFGADGKSDGRVHDEIQAVREANNVNIPKAQQALAFNKKVDERQKDFGVGGDIAAVTAAAGGGAALGSAFGPLGSVVGAAVAGTAAYLNEDQLTKNAARAYEITALSTKENGLASGFFEGVHQWSGIAAKEISPLSNLVQGSADIGHIGDGKSSFYKTNPDGSSATPTWMRVADVAASVGDAMLQFASPIGAALYTGQMSSTILGETGSLITSGGKTFDDRQGDFDNIFTNDKGQLDLGAAAAGIGNVGIDVVQLGMTRGLIGKADSSMRAIGEQGAYSTGRLGFLSPGNIGRRLPEWAGGRNAVQTEAIAKGGKVVDEGGFRFAMDAEGNVMRDTEGRIRKGAVRPTLALLAPSEALSSISAKTLARRAAIKRETIDGERSAVTADDFYHAAHQLAQGEKRLAGAIVTGVGEATEEVMQGILEPRSHNASVSGSDLFQAALYGGAMGVGMKAGTSLHTATAEQKLSALGRSNYALLTGETGIDDKTWNARWAEMTPVQKKMLTAKNGGLQDETLHTAFKKIVADQAHTVNAGVTGAAHLLDAVHRQLASDLLNSTAKTDGTFVITQLEAAPAPDADGNPDPFSMPSDAVAASAAQTMQNLVNHHRGLAEHRTTLQADLDNAVAAATADPENAELQSAVSNAQLQVEQIERVLHWSPRVLEILDQGMSHIHDELATPETMRADIVTMNSLLRDMFNMRADLPTEDGAPLTDEDRKAIAKLTSLVFTRYPQDQGGSYPILVPQVSAALTLNDSHNMLEVSHAILAAIRGDYDGDKIAQQAKLVLNEEAFTSLRAGASYLGNGTSVNIGTPAYEAYNIEFLAEGLASSSPTLSSYATETLTSIGDAITRRYPDGGQPLQTVLESFFAAVHAGSDNARKVLLDGLAGDELGAMITTQARGSLSNEWLWIDQLIVGSFQVYQSAYATHSPSIGTKEIVSNVKPNRMTKDVRTRQRDRSATLGQTLGLELPGDSMFRKFQDLHYTSNNAKVRSAEHGEDRPRLVEMVQLYEALGQQLTSTELQSVRTKDSITARAFTMLQNLAKGSAAADVPANEALTVIANLKVSDIDLDDEGNYDFNGKTISVAQLFLKMSVQQDAREKAIVLPNDPDLQAKHRRLLAMTTPGGHGESNPANAEKAFIEIIGSQQLFNLIGDDAGPLGPHLTVEQFLRQYINQDELSRRSDDQALRSDPAYFGRKQSKNMPYDLSEVKDQEISAYRAVVDAILAVGHDRITIDKTGKLAGELAQRSDVTSAAFTASQKTMKEALIQFGKFSGRKSNELTADMVQRMIESHPDAARAVMALIPADIANVVLQIKPDGTVWGAQWFYETFAMKDPKEAEMHFWRNMLLSEWNALGGNALANKENVEGENGRQYSRLPRRMHRVLYQLNKLDDGGNTLARFMTKLEQSTNLEHFMQWVNTTPGVRGQQAPLVAWIDDTAEFDPDKASGGWTTQLQGASLREAISALQKASQRLVTSISEERADLQADTLVINDIRKWIAHLKGDTSVALSGHEETAYNQLQKALELAGKMATGLGPQAMIHQSVFATWGFYAQAHTKGKNPEYVQALGLLDASRDAFDYVTNYERLMNSMTSVNLDAVSSNLSELAKDGVRTMDDDGRQVNWDVPDVAGFLDMFDNADTRKLARAVLFPQVQERTPDGRINTQLLVGKRLNDLLDGSSYKELFPQYDGRLSQDSALRYASVINAQARRFGGHESLQRVVNEIVIAKTSAADKIMTLDDIQRLVVKTYQDVARTLQATGYVTTRPSWSSPLTNILKEVKTQARLHFTAGRLGLKGDKDEQMLTDFAIEQFIGDRKSELREDLAALAEELISDPASQTQIEARIEAAQADYNDFERRIEELRTDDIVAQTVAMFTMPADPTLAAAKKDALVSYVKAHLDMIQRVPKIKTTMSKLTMQLMDPSRNGQADLTPDEWSELGRASIALYLGEAAGSSAATISVTPFPDVDNTTDARYFDPTFGYLIDPLLDPKSPLVLAARELHRMAGKQDDQEMPDEEIVKILGNGIYEDWSLGSWTADIPRATIEANSRLDSASAPFVLTQSGNAPMRQKVINAALARTYTRPPEELLSHTITTYDSLTGDLFDNVPVILPGKTDSIDRPLAQLNNRFAKSVMIQFPGEDQPVDLLATDQQLGRMIFPNSDIGSTVSQSGYFEIHIERLKRAIETAATERGLSGSGLTVDIAYFHPDSIPVQEDAAWYNNIYFEGTSFRLDADQAVALPETLYFKNGGQSPAEQAASLDASKLGKTAKQVIETATAADRATAEVLWSTDLATVLNNKTRFILEHDLGNGSLDPEMFNAVHKDFKIRHFVIGTTEAGEQAMWSAEQVIEFQLNNPDQPLPLQDARLWVPTDDVLRAMLGEQGNQGVPRIFPDQLEVDTAAVPKYRGPTPDMATRFVGLTGETVNLEDTRVANRAHQSQLVVRAMMDQAATSAFENKLKHWEHMREPGWQNRSEIQGSEAVQFNAKRNLLRALDASKTMLFAENLSFDFSNGGVKFFGPRNPRDKALTEMMLHELTEATSTANPFRTGWIFREGSKESSPHVGLLSGNTIEGHQSAGLTVLPGDIVVVELDSFGDNTALAKKRIDYFVGRGATIILGASNGTGDMRAEMAEYLQSSSYTKIAGSKHAYNPIELGSRYQNQRARMSSLVETRGISKRSRLAVFLTRGKFVTEGAGLVNANNHRLGGVSTTLDIAPVNAFGRFNIPVESYTNSSQIAAIQAHLRGFDTDEGREYLAEMSARNIKPAEKEAAIAAFNIAFDRLLQQFDDDPSSVLPKPGAEFGTGDLIPLVDNQGRVLLYRHGMEAPGNPEALERMLATSRKGTDHASNVAVYSATPQNGSTTHTGRVVQFTTRDGHGMQVELDIDLQVFGDKKQLEWNGMKYILTPMPDKKGNKNYIALPEHGFFPGWGIDVVSDFDTASSKEATDDMLDNHRNAFAFLGIDFLDDVTEFFFPGTKNLDIAQQRDAQRKTQAMLSAIQTRAPRLPVTAADELISRSSINKAFTDIMLEFSVQQQQALGVDPGWLSTMDSGTVEAQIASAMVLYLMTPGAQVRDVMHSGGFNDTEADAESQSRLMPQLFTQVFDRAQLDSPLRLEINRRLNAQIQADQNGEGYYLAPNFDLEVHTSDGRKMVGHLMFAEAHSSGDNPLTNGMAFDRADRQSVSAYSEAIASMAINARTSAINSKSEISYDIAKSRLFQEASQITRFDKDSTDGGVWRLMTAIPAGDDTFTPWRLDTPAESARRSLAREAAINYRQPLNKDLSSWSDAQRAKYLDLSRSIALQLGLKSEQADLVDFWVRQFLGKPTGLDEDDNELGDISGDEALGVAQEIKDNVDAHYLPTMAADGVPLIHVADLQTIFRANRNVENGWRPRESADTKTANGGNDWSRWVEIALGSGLASGQKFDPMFLLATDGFMHSYQNATNSLLDLPISMDPALSQHLLDPATNRLVVSLNPDTRQIVRDPILVETEQANLDQILGGKRIAGTFRGEQAPASEIAKRQQARRRWRAETGTPIPVDVTMKNYRKNGANFVQYSTNTNAVARSLIHLRVGTALINPTLWISMGPEALIRGMLDRMSNALTGNATTGLGLAWRREHTEEWLEGKSKLADILSRLGFEASYTSGQTRKLQNLYDVMGQRSDFKSMVYRELNFKRPHAPAIGKVEKALEKYANLGSRMQDATYGVRGTTLARRYMEAATQYLDTMQGFHDVPLDTLISEMRTDPMYLARNFPEVHQAAAASIAQVRSLKPTPLSLALRGIYEPLSESSNSFLNFAGNVILKLPLLFSTYAVNVATTITGMQGYSDMVAMWADGREKPAIIRRAQALMRGEKYDADTIERFDMSEVLEGMDLSRSFIRGGITHTGLFALGLMAGGLGLTGEDDETRRRRRAAQLQGAGFVYDPRRIENDFRNADALWLGHMGVSLPWVAKQFISPVIGMERFFDTGDFREITWGFQDAISAFPLINGRMWADVVETAQDLVHSSRGVDTDSASGLHQSHSFLTSAVGTYERMLFESSFINQIYQAQDRYDRDPYAQPMLDSDETTQVDAMGQPRETDATGEFIDDKGHVQTGTIGRDGRSAQLHQLTENRATLAAVLSLFDGQASSSFLRNNMVIKTRSVEAPGETTDRAKAIIRSLEQNSGGAQQITEDEALNILRGRSTNPYVSNRELEPLAKKMAQQSQAEPLSVLDDAGRELLTHAGQRAIYRGLAKGTVAFDADSLKGIHITYEQRVAIQKEWTKELVQEGINLGLDQTKATSRMKRIMNGPSADPNIPGLSDIIWSKDISYTTKLEYNQLNTTYVTGPDGHPWATGFGRKAFIDNILPETFTTPDSQSNKGMDVDGRMNSTDEIAGQNLGMRALEPVNQPVPTDVEIGKQIEKAITEAAKANYTPFTPYANSSGSGGGGGFGGRRYGSGGGGSYAPTMYFTKMNPFQDQRAPYADDIAFINTSNPIIRRADVRRERVWSERGRLNQWQ